MGSCCGCGSVDEEAQALVQDRHDDQRSDRSASVELEEENDIDEPLPTIYYVIVGRGPMAVVNHRTLIDSTWGALRINGRTILHVGFPNPWPRYMQHGLGQPNHLLSFPGFQNQPSDQVLMIDGGLDSQAFGGCIDAEFQSFGNAVEVATEWVALIQSPQNLGAVDVRIANAEIGGGPVSQAITNLLNDPWPDFHDDDAPYRLCLYNPDTGTARLVYAAAIDICTGPGRPNAQPPTGGDTAEMRNARTPPWLRPEWWSQVPLWRDRRTLHGVDAIRDEVAWNNGDRVCVTAGGGVGLNAAEKARNNQCILDWFGRDALMPIFNNPRNITYLREPNTNHACQPGSRAAVGINNEDDLIAADDHARMGRGAVLNATAMNVNRVEVTLAPQGNTNIIRDWWGNQSALHQDGYWTRSAAYGHNVLDAASRLYDRLVVPNGQNTQQVGQPHSFAHHLGFQAVTQGGRLVALETADGLVRVLGAACNNYPGFDQGTWINGGRLAAGSPANVMWTFHATLPVSAVIDGFIICGVNTALANRYFTDHPNMNVNTMTHAEILAVVNDGQLATTIVTRRNANNGYRDLQDLQQQTASQAVELAQFQYAY